MVPQETEGWGPIGEIRVYLLKSVTEFNVKHPWGRGIDFV